MLAVLVAGVLLGPFVYRVPIDAIDFKAKRKGPSWAHPLGADDLGQDLLARMLYGGRISLAVGVAAMMHHKLRGLEGKRVCAVVSGGNIDVNLVARVIERGLVKDGRLVRIDIKLLDKPGQLAKVSSVIAHHRANVIEVHHSRASSQRSGDTTLLLTLETRGPEHAEEILRALRERGYPVERM